MNGASQKGILIALGVVVAAGVSGAVASPANTPQIIGFTTLIATSLLGLLAQIYTANRQDEKLTKVERTGDATHTLVNSAMSAQLRLNAVMARRLATLTSDPADHALAATAEAEYHNHESQQRIVDKGYGIAVNQHPPLAPIPAPLPPAPVPVAPVATPAVKPLIEPEPVETLTIKGHEMAEIQIKKGKAD